jgi:phosphoenolpyruvate phosphomutase
MDRLEAYTKRDPPPLALTARASHSASTRPSKSAQFRALLDSPELEFLCEAHNGISARICEEAGFKGIWASGLCLAAQYGVRDSNEASWTQVLEMLEFMSDATHLPILLDGDTGYGNFNNTRRLVHKLETRYISAVCIEDKLFPKSNSFLNSLQQPLADVEEFCGKIKAAKDAQQDDDFCVLARVEALVAGWGLSEALERAEAYRAAGADGILIHSTQRTADEVLAFKSAWGNRAPVVIVPTRYYSTPTEVFRQHGFSIVIWANHLLRCAIKAMQRTASELAADQCLHNVEDRVAPLAEVFRLQGAQELLEAEQKYLPPRRKRVGSIVLAASRGKELGALTEDVPKAAIAIRGKRLLEHVVDAYRSVGVNEICVVRGYRKSAIDLPSLQYVDNDEFSSTGEAYSLHLALAASASRQQDLLICYGDVLVKRYILEALIEAPDDVVIAVDTNWRESVNRHRAADYVHCSMPHSRAAYSRRVTLLAVGETLPEQAVHGEWMGLLKVRRAARQRLASVTSEVVTEPEGRKAKLLHIMNALVERGEMIRVLYTTGHWLDVDSVEDVMAAGGFV